MQQGYSRSKILSLSKTDGNRVEDPNAMKSMVVDFFEKLLRQPDGYARLDDDLLSQALPMRISSVQSDNLGREVTDEEIKTISLCCK